VSAAERLADILASEPGRLTAIGDHRASAQPSAGGWSKKEILGHLIDSAANNHQRFVRAQLQSQLDFPGYEQESWVTAQAYASEPWADLVNLWFHLNRHLLHIIRRIPPDRLVHTCAIGGRPQVALSSLIDDYVTHLTHHLQQID
jgi:hypothetical protein